jgi:hypothetical protein
MWPRDVASQKPSRAEDQKNQQNQTAHPRKSWPYPAAINHQNPPNSRFLEKLKVWEKCRPTRDYPNP